MIQAYNCRESIPSPVVFTMQSVSLPDRVTILARHSSRIARKVATTSLRLRLPRNSKRKLVTPLSSRWNTSLA